MTKVEISGKMDKWSVSVTGHAGYATDGKDIVCAAVSILTGTMVQRIHEEEANIEKKEIAPGVVRMEFSAKKEKQKEMRTTMETILTGFLLLENKYRNFVKVSYKI